MVPRPEQGADNGRRHRRWRRLGLEAPVDDMGGTGELHRHHHRQQRQQRPRREEDPLRSPHHVLRLQEGEGEERKGWFWFPMGGEKTRHRLWVFIEEKPTRLARPTTDLIRNKIIFKADCDWSSVQCIVFQNQPLGANPVTEVGFFLV